MCIKIAGTRDAVAVLMRPVGACGVARVCWCSLGLLIPIAIDRALNVYDFGCNLFLEPSHLLYLLLLILVHVMTLFITSYHMISFLSHPTCVYLSSQYDE